MSPHKMREARRDRRQRRGAFYLWRSIFARAIWSSGSNPRLSVEQGWDPGQGPASISFRSVAGDMGRMMYPACSPATVTVTNSGSYKQTVIPRLNFPVRPGHHMPYGPVRNQLVFLNFQKLNLDTVLERDVKTTKRKPLADISQGIHFLKQYYFHSVKKVVGQAKMASINL